MTRLFAVLVLAVILLTSFLLPAEVKAVDPECPFIITVTTLPATDVTATTATFHGQICLTFNLPGGQRRNLGQGDGEPQIVFQYGNTPGSYTHNAEAVFESEWITENGICATVKASVEDLTPCAIYYVRLQISHILISAVPYLDGARGAGIGLDYGELLKVLLAEPFDCSENYYNGNEISFQTPGCLIGSGSHGSGGVTGVSPTAPPMNLTNIIVQSATMETSKVAPGEKVNITASVTNKGGSNGTSKVTLYINGQEAESKGITLSSGESRPLHFSVSRNDPGTYTVYVNGVSAGSFTVDLFTNNDALIVCIIALFAVGIIGVLYLIVKRRTA